MQHLFVKRITDNALAAEDFCKQNSAITESMEDKSSTVSVNWRARGEIFREHSSPQLQINLQWKIQHKMLAIYWTVQIIRNKCENVSIETN